MNDERDHREDWEMPGRADGFEGEDDGSDADLAEFLEAPSGLPSWAEFADSEDAAIALVVNASAFSRSPATRALSASASRSATCTFGLFSVRTFASTASPTTAARYSSTRMSAKPRSSDGPRTR